MKVPSFADAERFRGWVAERFGLQFADDKLSFLANLMTESAARLGMTVRDYLESLADAAALEEWRPLIEALTVPETYFFRHLDQFEAFRHVALPYALTAAGTSGKVRILCAGCASGEEPYSLAIWMREHGVDLQRVAPIRAVDLNAAVLRKAVAARYSPWALRETAAPIRDRWFEPEGRNYLVADAVRRSVEFEELNLADGSAGFWSRASFDVIFCRNVLMYFRREAAAEAVARLSRALTPGGYLFMGHAETLRDLSTDFELCHSHGAFYYRRQPKQPAAIPTADVLTWPSAVQDSRQRVAELDSAPAVAPPRVEPTVRAPDSSERTRLAWRLLAEERFADALEALDPMPEAAVKNLDQRLMRAALLTHAGRLQEAERECASLLRWNARSAGAHYLLALCRDGANDRRGAIDHDREAIVLSPQFALPPLHLGLMARRAGDLEEAARHFDLARELLQTEDEERLLLFGGGFSRAALTSLCGERRSRNRRKAWR